MNRHWIGRILLGLLLIAVIAGVGVAAYSAGLAQGAGAPFGAGVAGRELMPGFGHGGRGLAGFWPLGLGFFGFGLLGLAFKALLFFGLIALAARLIFRPRWGRGPWGHGPWGGDPGQGVPPMFAEWHRRAHGEAPAPAEPAAPQPPSA
ncbi:MAG: hypothetical protein JNK29_08635 [Anaerolineales bacterium]|nr:hypothetical protein [Anaerolineales bacterium]